MSEWNIFTKTEVLRIGLLWLRIFTLLNPFRTCYRLENNLKALNKSRYFINEQFLACLLWFFTPQKCNSLCCCRFFFCSESLWHLYAKDVILCCCKLDYTAEVSRSWKSGHSGIIDYPPLLYGRNRKYSCDSANLSKHTLMFDFGLILVNQTF